jgi:hypothetical protein
MTAINPGNPNKAITNTEKLFIKNMIPIEFNNKLIMNKQLIAQITLNPVIASCSLMDFLNNFLLI